MADVAAKKRALEAKIAALVAQITRDKETHRLDPLRTSNAYKEREKKLDDQAEQLAELGRELRELPAAPRPIVAAPALQPAIAVPAPRATAAQTTTVPLVGADVLDSNMAEMMRKQTRGAIDEANKRVGELQAQLNNANVELEQVRAEIEQSENERRDEAAARERNAVEVQRLTGELANAEGALAQANARITTLSQQSLGTGPNGAVVAQLNGQISELTQKIGSLESQLLKANADAKTAQANAQVAVGQLEEKVAQASQKQEQVAAQLKRQTEASTRALADAEQQYDETVKELQAQIDTNNTRIAEKDATITLLKAEQDALRTQLKAEQADLERRLAAMKTRADEAQARVGQLEQNAAEQEQRHKEYTEVLEAQIARLQKQIGEFGSAEARAATQREVDATRLRQQQQKEQERVREQEREQAARLSAAGTQPRTEDDDDDNDDDDKAPVAASTAPVAAVPVIAASAQPNTLTVRFPENAVMYLIQKTMVEQAAAPTTAAAPAVAVISAETKKNIASQKQKLRYRREKIKAARSNLVSKGKRKTDKDVQGIADADAAIAALEAEIIALDGGATPAVAAPAAVAAPGTASAQMVSKMMPVQTPALDVMRSLFGPITGVAVSANQNRVEFTFPLTVQALEAVLGAVISPVFTFWATETESAWEYWVYTLVPVFARIATVVRNTALNFEGDFLKVLSEHFMFVLTVALAGHESEPSGKVTGLRQTYRDTVFKKITDSSYAGNPTIAALFNQATDNQYGAMLPTVLRATPLEGVPSPLLAVIFDALASADSPGDFTSTELWVALDSGKQNLKVAVTPGMLSNPYDLITLALGLPVLDVLFAERNNGVFVSDRADDSIPENSLSRVGPDASTTFAGLAIPEFFVSVGKGAMTASDELFDLSGNGRLVIKPLHSVDGALPKYNRVQGEPNLAQIALVTAAINVQKDNDAGAELAFVLYQLASLDDIWYPSYQPVDEATNEVAEFTQETWRDARMAWAHKIVDVVLFTPFTNDSVVASFFQRFGQRPAALKNTVVQSQARAGESVDSALSLRDRYNKARDRVRSSLAKELANDSVNKLDISVYRKELERFPMLAELFDSPTYHTVLVPNNLALIKFEEAKIAEYRNLPAAERLADEDSYVDFAINNALHYYMLDGDIDFELKRGAKKFALASLKTNRRGVGLRLYATVDKDFSRTSGGTVELAATDDGSEPISVRLGGQVRGKNGVYYVVDRMIDSAPADRQAGLPNYAPPAAYAPEPIVTAYQSLPLPPPETDTTVSSQCHVSAEIDLLRNADLNREEFLAFEAVLQQQIGDELQKLYEAGEPLHIFVPTKAVLATASGLSGEPLKQVLRTHVARNETFTEREQSEAGVVTEVAYKGKFRPTDVRRFLKNKAVVSGRTLNDTIGVAYGQAEDEPNRIGLTTADFVFRKPSYSFIPETQDPSARQLYERTAITVLFVTRLLVPRSRIVSSKAALATTSSEPQSSNETGLRSQAAWRAAVSTTAAQLRNEANGDALTTHIGALERELEAHGGASALGLTDETVRSQSKLLTEAISHNDVVDASYRSDAREAVLDLYQRFPATAAL